MRTWLALVIALLLLAGAACGDDDEPDVAAPPDTAATVDDDLDTVDANGDSYLDGDEVAEWVDDAGFFGEWDIDADSELDFEEISGNAFELWDLDNSGAISESEWERSVEVWYPAGYDVVAFADWDADGTAGFFVHSVRRKSRSSQIGPRGAGRTASWMSATSGGAGRCYRGPRS